MASTTGIWLNDDEHSMLISKAAEQGLSLGKFIKKQALRKPIIRTKSDPRLMRQIAAIGNNANQLARWANSNPKADSIEMLAVLHDIENALSGIRDAH